MSSPTSSHAAFAPLRRVLYLAVPIVILTGVLEVLFSVRYNHWMSQSLSSATLIDPMLNSQYRFNSAMWLCQAAILIAIISDPVRYAHILRTIAVFVFIGGIGRTYDALTLGLPKYIIARVADIAFIGIEFVLPVLAWTLLARGLRESGQKDD